MAGPSGEDLFINVTGSGDNTLLAAPGEHMFYRVLQYHLTSDRPTTVLFKSGSEEKNGTFATFGSGGGEVSPMDSGEAVFDCNLNEPLILNSSVEANILGSMRVVIKGGRTYN